MMSGNDRQGAGGAPSYTEVIAPGTSKPGDYVVVRAKMPVIAVLSNCPQQNKPSSGFKPTPIEVAIWDAPVQ
jgi:hypothetical protein